MPYASSAAIAVGLWWNANTISHIFIHRPFFRSRLHNRLFSALLSLLLGIPQSLWRDWHLAHHRGAVWHLRSSPQLIVETSLVLCLWTTLAMVDPRFFLRAYVPGYALGLGLCALQGHYEHVSGVISHYGRLYNLLCFNDGFHAEHHAHPGIHWTQLPKCLEPGTRASRWPALLRWMDHPRLRPRSVVRDFLHALEGLVIHSRLLQRFVLERHRRAFAALIPLLPPVRRVVIVGGGLFPRTALVLRDLLPQARIAIVDASSRNLETARPLAGCNVDFIHGRYVPGGFRDCDVIVIPLSFDGRREAISRQLCGAPVLVHDWIWRRRGTGRIVSTALLKRLNLIDS
jgi:hypothetical protein